MKYQVELIKRQLLPAAGSDHSHLDVCHRAGDSAAPPSIESVYDTCGGLQIIDILWQPQDPKSQLPFKRLQISNRWEGYWGLRCNKPLNS